tara:strand:+ start:815 stop:1072 length:258 start_codon:yes stop_codon:yes gene_type:complete
LVKKASRFDPTVEDELAAERKHEFDMEDFVAQNDRCVICSKNTRYTKGHHIHERYGYIEGFGQLCSECYNEKEKDLKLIRLRGGM